MSSRLAIALAVLTCLAWSPINASDVDTVVPENMADNKLSAESSHLHPLVLLATSAIKTELDNMKTYPIAAAAVTPIQQMVQDLESAATDSKASNTCHAKNTADASTCSALTTVSTCNGNDKCSWASDGGTADIAAALSTAKTNINNALTTMRDALVSDYNQAKGDLNTLDAAIDNSERTITPSELEAIKTKASNWCTARGEKTQADQAAQTANSVLSTKLNVKLSDLNVADIKVSEIGALGEGACSKASGVAEGGNCPTSSCSLATRITTALDTANKEYLDASWDKYNKDTTKSTKQNADDNAKGNFNTIVDTTASNYHAMCSSQDTVHGAAVKMFNDNNAHRASTYRSLGVIMCHINHMETPSQSYNLPTNLVKSGGTAATTDANHCLSQLKSTADLKTALFPAATATEDSNKACPTLQKYVDQIKAYGSLNFEKDVWTPSQTNCDAVSSHSTSTVTPSPLVGTAVLFDTGADYDRSVAGKLTRNTPTSSDNGVACSNELINSGLPGVKFTCPNHDASFVGFVDASATPTKSSDLTWAAFCQTPRYWIREWDSAQSAQWLKDWCTTTEVSCENDETFKFTTSTVFEVRVNSANQVEYAVHVGSNVVLLHTSTLAVTTPIKMCTQIYYNNRPVTNIQWLDAL
jgi:hypothetical protein